MDAKIKELKLLSPDGNALSDVRKFNMMLETKVGAKDLKMLFGELGLSLTVRAQEVSIPVWKSLVAAYRG
jgi:hypothetical protein